MIKDLNLENIKIGDEVVTVTFDKNGKINYGVRIYTISDFDERLHKYRLKTSEKNAGLLNTEGNKYFMSKNPDADFYYSANADHIKKVKKNIEIAKAKRKKLEQEESRKLNEFMVKLDSLMKEYGVQIYPIQTNGDTHGVEIDVCFSVGSASTYLDD